VDRRPLLRASDADRERVAQRLREAAIDGRISAQELDERLGGALRAATYGELDQLIVDLPAATTAAGDAAAAANVTAAAAPNGAAAAQVRPARASSAPAPRVRSQRMATASLALVVLALDLVVVDRWEILIHEAGGMSAGRVMSAVGLSGVTHVAEVLVAVLCVVLLLVATLGRTRKRL
jgi:hypothetical protein